MTKYNVGSINGCNDGSGNINWYVFALDDNDELISNKRFHIYTPLEETAVALDTGVAALIALLIQYAPEGFDGDTLSLEDIANQEAADVAQALRDLVAGLGGFPRPFSV